MTTLPAVALRGTAVLPGMIVHFDISRPRSAASVNRAMLKDQKIFLILQRDVHVEDPAIDDVWNVGVYASIKQVVKLPKNMIRVLVEGIERAEIIRLEKSEDYLEALVSFPQKSTSADVPAAIREAMLRGIRELFAEYCRENGNISRDVEGQIMEIDDLADTLSQISINLPLPYEKRQLILEAITVEDQYETLGMLLANETEVIRVQREIQEKVRQRVDKNQREYVLREQLKVIREELGEDTTQNEIDRFKEQAGKLKAKKEVKEKIFDEIIRLQNLPA